MNLCDQNTQTLKSSKISEADSTSKEKDLEVIKTRLNKIYSTKEPSSAISIKGIYPRVSGKGLKFSEPLPESLMDSRLVIVNGKFYTALPRKEKRCIAESQSYKVVSIDPGIRAFHSFYTGTHTDHIATARMGEKIKNLIDLLHC